MAEDSWKVMIGVLHGFGQCMWEELRGQIRKVSHLFVTETGQVGLTKAIIGGVFVGCDQIPADGLVIFSVGATDEQHKNFHGLWSRIVMPTNGAVRFKLDK